MLATDSAGTHAPAPSSNRQTRRHRRFPPRHCIRQRQTRNTRGADNRACVSGMQPAGESHGAGGPRLPGRRQPRPRSGQPHLRTRPRELRDRQSARLQRRLTALKPTPNAGAHDSTLASARPRHFVRHPRVVGAACMCADVSCTPRQCLKTTAARALNGLVGLPRSGPTANDSNGALRCSRPRRIGCGRWPVHAALVGEDHDLHAVAELELHQDPLDVGPDRRFLDDQLARDLAVR